MPEKRQRRINRFTVMAMLQAARAHRLGLPEPAARSWGLNRAIFYAAAKKGFRAPTGLPISEEKRTAEDRGVYYLGDEMAYRTKDPSELRFTIGGEPQTPEEFQRQIASRFGSEEHFREAWQSALEWVARFPEETLRSGRQFYSTVYKPRRDELVVDWGARYNPPAG